MSLLLLFKRSIILFIFLSSVHGDEGKTILNDLKIFESFIGKTFVTNIENKKKKLIGREVVKWESVLKGDAIKIHQYINKNELVGESIIMYDIENDQISCWYFSSGGVVRKSKLLKNENQIIFIEDVTKNNNSITKIRTRFKFIEKSSYQKTTQFLINNVWTEGTKFVYKELK